MIKRKRLKIKPLFGESGFTIIESLVAIIVIAILMSAIAPVIVLSTATRLQSKRIEQATQASRAFIDGIKTQTIDPEKIVEKVELEAATKEKPRTDIKDYLIDSLTKMPVPPDKSKLFCIDKNGKITLPGGDCGDTKNNGFFIQAAKIKVLNSQPNDGYRLAIRVYRKDAFDTPGVLLASDSAKNTKQSTVTGGLGQTKTPLVEMTTDIGNSSTSFSSLCNRLGIAKDRAANEQQRCD
jgi:prepilin-type N-terminal cleavage/methylation domain-containing protein